MYSTRLLRPGMKVQLIPRRDAPFSMSVEKSAYLGRVVTVNDVSSRGFFHALEDLQVGKNWRWHSEDIVRVVSEPGDVEADKEAMNAFMHAMCVAAAAV